MSNTQENHESDLRLVVEKLRLMGYAGFWLVVITGIILTRLFSGINLDDSLLTQVFGYNNICVYFDFAPSTYVLPLVWAVTLVLLLLYIVVHWMRMREEMQEGTLTPALYKTLTSLKVFEALTFISFTTIFAVNPGDPNDGTYTLVIHTMPFFLLQLGMVSLAMSNTLHGIRSGYWQRLGLPSWFTKGAIVYCIIFAMVVAFKIPVATNAMVLAFMSPQELNGLGNSIWWEQTPLLKSIAMFADKMFLVCAAIIPMLKATYLIRCHSDKIDVVVLRTRLVTA
ncbi:hypothetical protein [Colwellia sp. TT2012]|uniref:hypothetical protein n=1 Tax=Colwellia sp. TT2012 TaxID=1720342 RepID=UPI00070FE637|nr:hypothetical protein [Colwellia sp. TT2012]